MCHKDLTLILSLSKDALQSVRDPLGSLTRRDPGEPGEKILLSDQPARFLPGLLRLHPGYEIPPGLTGP